MMTVSDINSAILDIANEGALKEHRKDKTVDFLREEVQLLKKDIHLMDITNLRKGPYTEAAINKIKQQKEVLDINTEKISDRIKNNLVRKYDKMLQIIDEKLEYGQKVSLYLDEKDNDFVEVVKSNMLEDDLSDFENIRSTLRQFKLDLLQLAEEVESSLYRLNKGKKTV